MDKQTPEKIKPTFDFDAIKNEVDNCIKQGIIPPIHHKDILAQLLEQIEPVNFMELADLNPETGKLKQEHFFVICIDQILKVAESNSWGMCRNHSFIYL